MEPTPEWIALVAPFASGAVGVGVTAGIAWGMIKQKYIDIERRMGVAERRLENQVGESRCYKMREECRNTLANGMNEIKEEIINNRNWVTDRFTEIVRFMGAHNGK